MRPPDLSIGPRDNPYMLRWHLLRWRGWQLCLHKICRDDDDRALHDHRGNNISIILKGGYLEWFSHRWEHEPGARGVDCVWRRRFVPYYRKAETPHRLTLARGYERRLDSEHYDVDGTALYRYVQVSRPAWTLWLRWPARREWGFHCPKGWRHWREFCTPTDYETSGISEIGPGCD